VKGGLAVLGTWSQRLRMPEGAEPQAAKRWPAPRLVQGYDPGREVNLSGHLASLSAYSATLAAVALVGRRSGAGLPGHYPVKDLLLGGIAVHKFTRLVSKSSVMSPVRAPFTEFEEASGAAEHVEASRGEHGLRHTVGELLTCPFCLGVWTGTGYVAALTLAPRQARTWAALFTVTFISDSLQFGYEALRELG
jgi:hypothetical protein